MNHMNPIEEKYLTTPDGTKLYYTMSGTGEEIDFLLCDGIGCDGFVWPYLKPYLEEIGRVIHLHMRGHGKSGLPTDYQLTQIEDLAKDWQQVIQIEKSQIQTTQVVPKKRGRPTKNQMPQQASKPRKIIAIGHSLGVQVALELARQTPHWQWAGLVLMCGTFEHPVSTFHNAQMLERFLPLLKKAVELGGDHLRKVWQRLVNLPLAVQVAKMTEMNGNLTRKRDIEAYLRHLGQMEPKYFLEMLMNASKHSARSYLGELDMPTLIIAGGKDNFTPARLSEEMQALMKNAKLIMIQEGTHATPIEHTIEVNSMVRRFIQDQLASQSAS